MGKRDTPVCFWERKKNRLAGVPNLSDYKLSEYFSDYHFSYYVLLNYGKRLGLTGMPRKTHNDGIPLHRSISFVWGPYQFDLGVTYT